MHNVIPFALNNIKLSCSRHTPTLIKGHISPGKDESKQDIWSTWTWIKGFLFLPSFAIYLDLILHKTPIHSPQTSLPQTFHFLQPSVRSKVEWRFGFLAEDGYPKTKQIWSWWSERKQAARWGLPGSLRRSWREHKDPRCYSEKTFLLTPFQWGGQGRGRISFQKQGVIFSGRDVGSFSPIPKFLVHDRDKSQNRRYTSQLPLLHKCCIFTCLKPQSFLLEKAVHLWSSAK